MKKVLSLVLTLALVLSSFSMAFADEAKNDAPAMKNLTDVAGNANEEAIGVVSDLGIVTGNPDGTFQPEKAVTRAEYAAMITRALAIPQSALAGYASTSFKDTDGYGWAVGYLAFCNSKGIMLGDGQGNAMPGRTVTLNEAITMALRAIGYTANSAELKGNWPANYVTKAQELNLYSDLAKDLVSVDKANAAQLIYNILTVQKVAVNSDGKTEFIFDKDKNKVTLLSSGLNCTESEGYVVYTEDTIINVAKYVGQYGKIYRNDDKKIVAFISDSTQLTGRFTAVDKFVTTDEEKEYNVKTSYIGALLADNGEDVQTPDALPDGTNVYNITNLAPHGINSKEVTISADVSGKTIKAIYTAVPWTVTEAKKVKAADVKNVVADKELLSVKFKEDDNDKLDYTQFQLVGAASLGDIKADDVVYVYKGSKYVRRVEVGTKTAEGVIRNFKKESSTAAAKFKIGDATFKNASKVVNNVSGGTTVEASNVSDEVKAFLDARGYVFDVEKTKKANNFAVVKAVGDTGINTQVQLLFADGTKKVVSYDKSDVAVFQVGDINDSNVMGNVKYPVIGYSLNKDGDMDSANKYYAKGTVNLGSKNVLKFVDAPAMFGSSEAVNDNGDATENKNELPKANDTAKISSDVIVFTVDTASNGDYTELAVTTIDKVETKVNMPAVVLFDESKEKMDKKTVIAMLVFKDQAEAGGTDSYAVVNEYTRDSNADGDKVWEVKGFKDGTKLEALTKVANNDNFTSFFAGYTSPIKGSEATYLLYKVVVDTKGVITKATAKAANKTVAAAAEVDGRKSVDGEAISDKAVFYEVTSDDEFRVTSADLKVNDKVVLFETDDDEDGYDVVIFSRK